MRAFSACVLSLCSAALSTANGQVAFAEPVLLTPLISEVRQPFLADLAGNGSLEIVLGSTGPGRVISVPQDSLEERRILLEGEVKRELFTMGDVDGDGLPDLLTGRAVLGTGNASRCIALYRNLGDGNFAPPLTIAEGTAYTVVLAGDLTGDGREEIVARRSQSVDVFHFADGELVLLHMLNGSWSGIHLADLSGDGVQDLVLYRSTQPRSVAMWNAIADPTGQPVQIVSDLTSNEAVVASDINGDGLVDLHLNYAWGPLTLWLGEGGGTMGSATTLDFGMSLRDFHVRNTPGGQGREIWAHQYGVIHRFLVSGDLAVLSSNMVTTMPDHIRAWRFGPEGTDGILDLFVITEDDQLHRLRFDTGTSTLLSNEVLFGWNHLRTGGMVARDNADGERSLHFLSNGSNKRTHAMAVDPFEQGTLNRPKRLRLPNADWISTLGTHGTLSTSLYELDLDGDGVLDLMGHLNDWNPFGMPCRYFAILDPDNDPQYHCLYTGSLGGNDIDVIQGWSFLDFDNDGLTDIVVHGSSQRVTGPVSQSAFIRRLKRTSDLQFTVLSSTLTDREFRIHQDMDGDGLDDLLVAQTEIPPQLITVKQNNGDGSFTPVNTIPYGFEFGWVRNNWGVVDADATLSLLRFVEFEGHHVHHQRVLHNALAAPEHFFSGSVRPILHDMNGDGHLDVIQVEPTGLDSMTLTVFINDGDFPLLQGTVIYVGLERHVVPLEVDGDGMADIVLARGPAVHWMRNLIPPVAPPPTTSGTFTVFPNPTAGTLTVDLGIELSSAIRLDMFDSSGRSVRAYSSTRGINTLDVSTLANGIYLLRAFAETEGTSLGVARIVVQHAP